MAPRCVVSADVHYNLTTLPLVDKAMRQAIAKAEELKVPFIVAGDLHDTKALMRGECVAAMINTFKDAKIRIIIIPGNHCRINQNSPEHSLEFLRPYAEIIDKTTYDKALDLWLIPYHSENEYLLGTLARIPRGATIIGHQGVQGAAMGTYVLDKSSLPVSAFSDFRVLLGHYHRRQDIGTVSYIGNPVSLSFGEALDPPKGFQILMDDGTLQFVPTNLRKHIIVELETGGSWEYTIPPLTDPIMSDDLVWVKLKGSRSSLAKINKKKLGEQLSLPSNFKLDLIPIDSIILEKADNKALTGAEIFDRIIDDSNDTEEYKKYLKSLWREII